MSDYKVTYLEDGLRLDKALVSFLPEKSRSYLASLIDDGNCLVNGKVEKASFKVKEGDVISVTIPDRHLLYGCDVFPKRRNCWRISNTQHS